MEEQKTIAVRLEPEHLEKLSHLVKITGWNQSEVIRRLIEVAAAHPAQVYADLSPKGQPLTDARVPA